MTSRVYVTTSWDDGHPCDLRIAQLLERYGLRGTFYVPRRNDGMDVLAPQHYLSFGPAAELGAHTVNHTPLTWVNDNTAQREVADSKAWMEDQTGRPCPMFCPPRGKFHGHHLGMIADAGFEAVRTVEAWSLDPPRRQHGLAVIPTTVQAYPNETARHLRNTLKRRSFTGATRFLRFGLGRDWTDSLRSCLNVALSRGGVVHLWGHSWEIVGHSAWAKLDAALRELGRVCRSGRAEAITNGQLAARFTEPTRSRRTTADETQPSHPGPRPRAPELAAAK